MLYLNLLLLFIQCGAANTGITKNQLINITIYDKGNINALNITSEQQQTAIEVCRQLIEKKEKVRLFLKMGELDKMLTTEEGIMLSLNEHESIDKILTFKTGRLKATEAGSIYIFIKYKNIDIFSDTPFKVLGGTKLLKSIDDF